MPRKERTIMDRCGSILSRRFHTVCELRRKLYKLEKYEPREIEDTLRQLIRLGFLNDDRYAHDAAALMRERGYGPMRIRRKFREKGLAPELTEQVIRENFAANDPDVTSEAAALLAHRSSLKRESDPAKRKAKALRFLAGRGYDAHTAYQAVAQMDLNGKGDF